MVAYVGHFLKRTNYETLYDFTKEDDHITT